MTWLGWYGSDGKCWCAVRVQDGNREAAILNLVSKIIEGSSMELRETDRRPISVKDPKKRVLE